MKRRGRWLAIGLGALALYLLSTGGLVFARWRDFGAQRDLRLTSALESDLWIDARSTFVGLPLLGGMVHRGDPYEVRLQLWDKAGIYGSFHLTRVEMRYVSDGFVSRAGPFAWDFQVYSPTVPDANKLIVRVPHVVPRWEDGVVTIEGSLRRKDGTVEPVLWTGSLEARTTSFTTSYWHYFLDE